MKRFLFVAVALALVGLADRARANPFEYAWKEIAPGVWAGIRQDPFELPQEGNTVFVVTKAGVVVFDAGGSPLMGESIVAQVRAVTKQPVTRVFLSHWHGDHMRGLQSIRAAFPDARILAHPHTRDMIVSTRDRWLKRRESMVPNVRKNVGEALANGRDMSGRPLIAPEKAWLEAGLGIADQLDRENRRTEYVMPTDTLVGNRSLHLGGRDIELIHPGNAHTAGDLMLWLPKERVLATGDIVTAPIPLMPSPYTADYAGVLERLRGLKPQTIIPGHGAIERDGHYLDLLIDTMHSVSTQMKSLVAQGLPESLAVERVDFSSVEARFTHGDAFLKNRFEDYVSKSALPHGAYLVETGKGPNEAF